MDWYPQYPADPSPRGSDVDRPAVLLQFRHVAAAKAAAADGTAAGISKHVMPRALFWFRWAAVVTWLAGAALLGRHFLEAFSS